MSGRARAVLHSLLSVATIATFLAGISVVNAPTAGAAPTTDIGVNKSGPSSVAAEAQLTQPVTDETPEAPGDSTGLPHESPLPEATDPEPQSHAEEERRPLPPLPIAHGWLEDDAVLEGQLEDLTQAAVSQGAPEKGSPAPLPDLFGAPAEKLPMSVGRGA